MHSLLQEVKSLSVLNQAKEERAFLITKRQKDNIAKSEASQGKYAMVLSHDDIQEKKVTVPFARMDCVNNPSPFQSGTSFLSEGRFQNCKDWFLSVADLDIVNGAVKGRFLVYRIISKHQLFVQKKRRVIIIQPTNTLARKNGNSSVTNST